MGQAEDEIANLFAGLQKANADRDKLSNDKKVRDTRYTYCEKFFIRYDSNSNFKILRFSNKLLFNGFQDLQDELGRLSKIVEELNTKLEEECMQKIEFQGQMDSQVEDFVVKKQIYEQEIMNIKSHREVEIAEMDGRLKKVILGFSFLKKKQVEMEQKYLS